MPGGLLMGLLGPRVGRVFDRLGAPVLVVPGSIGVLVGTLGLALLLDRLPLGGVVALHVVLMVSLAALFTPLFTLGLGALPPHLYSHGSSMLGTLQQVAGAVGTALAVMVMTLRTTSLVEAGRAPEDAGVSGIQWAFGTSAGVAVVTLALVLALVRRTSRGAAAAAEREVAPAA